MGKLGTNSRLTYAVSKRPAAIQVALPRSSSVSYNPLDWLGPNSPQAILPREWTDSNGIPGSEGASIGPLPAEQRRECET